MSTISPFEYVKDILEKKENIIRNADLPDEMEHAYNPWIVNKALSYYIDTCFQANVMNTHYELPNGMQFEYLINSVKKMKRRYAPWYKKDQEISDVEVVSRFYKYNYN